MFLVLSAALAIGAEPSDPVEEFREALRSESSTATNKDIIKSREANIKAKAARLVQLGDISRALLLHVDWRADLEDPRLKTVSDEMRQVDKAIRDELAARLATGLKDQFAKGNAVQQVAAARLIEETSAQAREMPGIRGNFLRRFLKEKMTPELVAVIEKSSTPPEVRQAAITALGRVEPPAKVVVPTFEKQLGSDEAIVRRAAARALGDLIRTADLAHMLIKRHGNFLAAKEYAEELVGVAAQSVAAARNGFADVDGEVRRNIAEACLAGSTALVWQLDSAEKSLGPDYTKRYPPKARANKPTAEERIQIGRDREVFDANRRLIRPVMRAVTDEAPDLIRTLGDADAPTAVAAAATLEKLGEARNTLRRMANNIPRLDGAEEKPDPVEEAFSEALRGAVPRLAKQVTGSKEVRVQLACLYALENLGDLAASETDPLLEALQDRSAYVRWGTVRVLGRMPAAERAAAAMAPLLKDENEYVRATTCLVLALYGPRAKPAVADLTKVVSGSDPRFRVLAMRAIAAIGEDAGPAAEELGKALSAPQAEVRLAAAAALVKLGPRAAPASAQLRKALDDSEPDVRKAASDALLRLK
jgi:HEAT repeat protein